jgi:hypothetical protein
LLPPRLELVAKYRILDDLVPLLLETETRRMALLILNNLTIPIANKPFILDHLEIMQALYRILQELPPETYLACLCIRHVSCPGQLFPERLLTIHFVENDRDDNLMSLLEILTVTFAPYLMMRTDCKALVRSAEAQALTWSTGIVQQLSKTFPKLVAERSAYLVVILKLIQHLSQHLPLHHWKLDLSLGDFCLTIIFQLAQANVAELRVLLLEDPTYLTFIRGNGIHAMRASWIHGWLLEEGARQRSQKLL